MILMRLRLLTGRSRQSFPPLCLPRRPHDFDYLVPAIDPDPSVVFRSLVVFTVKDSSPLLSGVLIRVVFPVLVVEEAQAGHGCQKFEVIRQFPELIVVLTCSVAVSKSFNPQPLLWIHGEIPA